MTDTKFDKSYGVTVYLTFDKRHIALTAEDIKQPVLIYHAESFYTAVSLGKLEEAIAKIGSKAAGIVGQGEESVENKIKDAIKEVKSIPGLGDALGVVLSNDLVITDFVINVPDKVYEFGLGLRFTEEIKDKGKDQHGESKYKLGPVSLDGISLLVKASPSA